MATDSRERMVRSAASLISARGVSATSFTDVLGDSGAPRGSIYHHFPEGKRQLAEAAVALTGERVLAAQRSCTATTPAGVLACFVALWRGVVTASGATAGCAVAGVAVDTDLRVPPGESGGDADAPALMESVRSAFRSWTGLLAVQLETAGLPAGRAGSVAVTTLAAMEGALILCRAEGDVGPLDLVAADLARLVDVDRPPPG
jgi:TetR/AcrR family transcriptional repressor of lmrAB and yxaGH operons